mmetsp:Transcript_26100/g.45979  ORF Transcript_26100/g.45979 Transcript_26100/m.45979 type:complete len:86 (-) Transcript_26100:15-272(-)
MCFPCCAAGRKKVWDRLDDAVSYQPARHPLHGIGIGLPMSMLYANYGSCDLEVKSTLGKGTVATLWIRQAPDVHEKIPLSVEEDT